MVLRTLQVSYKLARLTDLDYESTKALRYVTFELRTRKSKQESGLQILKMMLRIVMSELQTRKTD